MIDKGLCTGVGDFFQRIFTPEHDLGFPEFPAISEVITAIHAAGGAALCAHAASGFHGPDWSVCSTSCGRRNSTALNATTPTIRKKEHSACCSIVKSTVCLSAAAATAWYICAGETFGTAFGHCRYAALGRPFAARHKIIRKIFVET